MTLPVIPPIEELVAKIRVAMGILSEDILPTSVITHFITEWLTVYPDNLCLALYNATVSCYEWLINSSAASDASEGVVKREKEANVEVEMFERRVGENTQLWIDALSRFEENPSLMFPACRDQLNKVTTGRVIVGGVREDKIRDINCDRNIRTGGASEIVGVRWGTRKSFSRRRGFGGFLLPYDN